MDLEEIDARHRRFTWQMYFLQMFICVEVAIVIWLAASLKHG